MCAAHEGHSVCVPKRMYKWIRCTHEDHCDTHGEGDDDLLPFAVPKLSKSFLFLDYHMYCLFGGQYQRAGICVRDVCHSDIDCDDVPHFACFCVKRIKCKSIFRICSLYL